MSYVGEADLPDGSEGVSGLDVEQEDIRSHLLSFDRLMELCDAGALDTSPLYLSALWLARHRERGCAARDYLWRGSNQSQISAAPARVSRGTIARFTAVQPSCAEPPEQFIKPPEASEATVTPPKTIRSLIP